MNRDEEKTPPPAAADGLAAAATVAHELRGDLGVIRNCAWLLRRRGGIDEQGERWLRQIEERTQAAMRLVDDLLDLARAVAANRRPTRVDGIVKEAVGLVAIELPHEVAIRQEVPAELRARIDPEGISRVVRNLVRNAVQAVGPTGGAVTVSARPDGRDLVIEVADDGPGLPEGMDPFRPFASGRKDGCGLGLVVVKSVAEAHGGLVEAGRGPGGGARFTIRLPGAVVEAEG